MFVAAEGLRNDGIYAQLTLGPVSQDQPSPGG